MSHVVPCSIPSHILTCVIFTCSQTSHVTYHMISFDPLTSHMTSYMTNSNTWLLMPAFPLWFADTLTRLGRLPDRITCPLSYLGITPVRNSRTWMTERHSDLTMMAITCIMPGWNSNCKLMLHLCYDQELTVDFMLSICAYDYVQTMCQTM